MLEFFFNFWKKVLEKKIDFFSVYHIGSFVENLMKAKIPETRNKRVDM